MPKRKKPLHPDAPSNTPCAVPGCTAPAEYKAPKSNKSLGEYQWLCLEHIRDFNKAWNYFSDMHQDEIESFMKEAVTGHRPTWTRESHFPNAREQLEAALGSFMDWGVKKPFRAPPSLPPKQRKALEVLELDYPFTPKELKARYRLLVKRHHPDRHQGDKAEEERFKKIVAAYHLLTHMEN